MKNSILIFIFFILALTVNYTIQAGVEDNKEKGCRGLKSAENAENADRSMDIQYVIGKFHDVTGQNLDGFLSVPGVRIVVVTFNAKELAFLEGRVNFADTGYIQNLLKSLKTMRSELTLVAEALEAGKDLEESDLLSSLSPKTVDLLNVIPKVAFVIRGKIKRFDDSIEIAESIDRKLSKAINAIPKDQVLLGTLIQENRLPKYEEDGRYTNVAISYFRKALSAIGSRIDDLKRRLPHTIDTEWWGLRGRRDLLTEEIVHTRSGGNLGPTRGWSIPRTIEEQIMHRLKKELPDLKRKAKELAITEAERVLVVSTSGAFGIDFDKVLGLLPTWIIKEGLSAAIHVHNLTELFKSSESTDHPKSFRIENHQMHTSSSVEDRHSRAKEAAVQRFDRSKMVDELAEQVANRLLPFLIKSRQQELLAEHGQLEVPYFKANISMFYRNREDWPDYDDISFLISAGNTYINPETGQMTILNPVTNDLGR